MNFRRSHLPALISVLACLPLTASCARLPVPALDIAAADPAAAGLPRTSVGGGFADAGLDGQYFANASFNGTPTFTRRDVRIDFDWAGHSAGGSVGEPYKSFPAQNFSIRWTGRLLPRFSETYAFTAQTSGSLSVAVKEPSASSYRTVVAGGKSSGTYTFTAGHSYEIQIEYKNPGTAGSAHLAWSSPNTPREVIDPAGVLAVNTYTEGFTDAMKGSRNEWKAVPAGVPNPSGEDAPRDAHGWPKSDAGCIIWEGTDGHAGTYLVQFHGQADLSVQFDYAKFSDQKYDPATNTTTATMTVTDTGRQNFALIFKNSRRTADSPVGSGVTEIQVLTPTAPGSSTHFAAGTLFRPDLKAALRRFVALRFMGGTNWNNSVTWADVTPPDFSTQHFFREGESGFEGNGMAWEYKIGLANETGKDLYINIPETANDDYITKLAQFVKYGGDGHTPYTGPQASPVYPPLNSNLNVYVEFANEVWNVGFQAFHQNFDAAQAAVKNNTEEGKALTFDGDTDANVLWNRRYALRTAHISMLFRSVWGDAAMGNRVRPLLEWQYANYGWPTTAGTQMAFFEDYLNNGDGKSHVAVPHPPSYFLWGAGGAAYYNGGNEEGITTLIKDGSFETPPVSGQAQAPPISGLAWNGPAGVARSGTSLGSPALPALSDDDKKAGKPANSQFAYLQTGGSLTVLVTVPASQTSNVYGVRFRIAARKKPGAARPDDQSVDVYVDNAKVDTSYARDDWQTFSSATFQAAPGSAHTIRLAAAGQTPDAVAFVDDLSVTSVDAIFAGGVPSSGVGQPVESYANRLNITYDWARAYGLHGVAYEGGWALGGDAGGTPVQNWAKFHDPRTVAAQIRSINAFYEAGGSLYTFGTYSQWDEWGKADSEPLDKGIDLSNASLPKDPARAVRLPGRLTLANAVKDWGDHNVDAGTGGKLAPKTFLVWNVQVPATGTYAITPEVTGGTAQVLVDGLPQSGHAVLAAGQHTIRLKAVGTALATVMGVTVSGGKALTAEK